MQVAIICQHATTEADARIAAALDAELAGDDDEQATDESGPDDYDGGAGHSFRPDEEERCGVPVSDRE
jgi:hypothetical protein